MVKKAPSDVRDYLFDDKPVPYTLKAGTKYLRTKKFLTFKYFEQRHRDSTFYINTTPIVKRRDVK